MTHCHPKLGDRPRSDSFAVSNRQGDRAGPPHSRDVHPPCVTPARHIRPVTPAPCHTQPITPVPCHTQPVTPMPCHTRAMSHLHCHTRPCHTHTVSHPPCHTHAMSYPHCVTPALCHTHPCHTHPVTPTLCHTRTVSHLPCSPFCVSNPPSSFLLRVPLHLPFLLLALDETTSASFT